MQMAGTSDAVEAAYPDSLLSRSPSRNWWAAAMFASRRIFSASISTTRVRSATVAVRCCKLECSDSVDCNKNCRRSSVVIHLQDN